MAAVRVIILVSAFCGGRAATEPGLVESISNQLLAKLRAQVKPTRQGRHSEDGMDTHVNSQWAVDQDILGRLQSQKPLPAEEEASGYVESASSPNLLDEMQRQHNSEVALQRKGSMENEPISWLSQMHDSVRSALEALPVMVHHKLVAAKEFLAREAQSRLEKWEKQEAAKKSQHDELALQARKQEEHKRQDQAAKDLQRKLNIERIRNNFLLKQHEMQEKSADEPVAPTWDKEPLFDSVSKAADVQRQRRNAWMTRTKAEANRRLALFAKAHHLR